MVIMPTFLPVCMTPGSMKVLPSRMQLRDGGGVDEEFEGEDAAVAVGAGDELLGEDAAQRFADHDADLVALVGGEHVEHAVERARGVAGVQGAEHQVARFRGGDGERDGFEVAHFTDHDDVRILAQRAAEGGGEGLGVGVDLALVDVAALRLEDVFDRILERDDVVVAVLVDLIDEGGERGGLAGADGAGDEDEAVVIAGQGRQVSRQAEFLHRADLGVDDAEGHVDAEALLDDGGAEAAVSPASRRNPRRPASPRPGPAPR